MPAPCLEKTGPARPKPVSLSLAEVLQIGLPRYLKDRVLSPQQGKVLRAILACQTPALGAHCYHCPDCGREHVQLHSCRNRHCPRCQSSLAAAWLEKQQDSLLPVPYFHLVFTLPHRLNPLIRQNRAALYKLLFDSASQTLLEFGQHRFNGQLGITAVLHTWSQNLSDHYHLHCIVTGGALRDDGSWKSASPYYLFSVHALSRVFQGKFRAGLQDLFARKALEFHGELQALAQAGPFRKWLRQATASSWVVYAKKPFAGPRQVLQYLSLYTHRVALSQRRLLSLNRPEGTVSFSYKDYADGSKRKIMTLKLEEFIRRFLLHILPERFVKIRHYGILGNHRRQIRIQQIRDRLKRPARDLAQTPTEPQRLHPLALLIVMLLESGETSFQPVCPFCGSPRLRLHRIIKPQVPPPRLDSS
jgi:hypothetical protein